MSSALPNLHIQLVWADDDMLEVQLSASSEAFAGSVSFYARLTALADLASQLAGFPVSGTDVRAVEYGRDDAPGHGRARLRFYCRDATGHLAVEVSLVATPIWQGDVSEAAVIQVDAVPADIDFFIAQLASMGTRVGAKASLKCAS